MEMHPNWFWQNLLAQWVWWLLTIAGGVVLAILKKRAPSWASPALYGLGGSALIAVVILALGNLSSLPQQERVTPANVEAHVRSWCDALGLAIKRQPVEADSYFSFAVTLNSGNVITVNRIRERDRYIIFRGGVTVSPDHAAIIGKLSDEQRIRLTDELTLELARSKLGFTIGTPIRRVLLAKSVPIGNGLTEDVFAGYLDEIDSGILLVREAFRLALDRIRLIRPQQ